MGSMSTLAQIADRIGPLIGKLGSPHDGEVLSAARTLARTLDKHGFNFNDLAIAVVAEPVTRIVYRGPEPKSDWWQVADWCVDHQEWLPEKEAEFVVNMRLILSRPDTEPTPKQAKWLKNILERIEEEIAA